MKRRKLLIIDDRSAAALRSIGSGNLSAGLEAIAAALYISPGLELRPLETGKGRARCVYISGATAAALRSIGSGNMSAGARIAAAAVTMGPA